MHGRCKEAVTWGGVSSLLVEDCTVSAAGILTSVLHNSDDGRRIVKGNQVQDV